MLCSILTSGNGRERRPQRGGHGGDARRGGAAAKFGRKFLKTLDSPKKKDLVFIALGLDFVAPGFDFVASGFDFVAPGLEIVAREAAKIAFHVKQPRRAGAVARALGMARVAKPWLQRSRNFVRRLPVAAPGRPWLD